MTRIRDLSASRDADRYQAAGLVLDGVCAGYGETIVLEGIAFDLPPGGTLTVLGRNGVGKTTLLVTIMGYTRLHGGKIGFAGRQIAGLPSYRRARLGIGFVPQEREIFPSLTVEENLAVAARPDDGRWRVSTTSSPRSPSAGAISAISFRAASSRCWRSAARWSATRRCC